jgi:hypothetical protein
VRERVQAQAPAPGPVRVQVPPQVQAPARGAELRQPLRQGQLQQAEELRRLLQRQAVEQQQYLPLQLA